MRRLQTLCPQTYDGMTMLVTPCVRCSAWRQTGCSAETGAEHFPEVDAPQVPPCPLADRCQHQIQAGAEPCVVRRRGMVCESALRLAGVTDPEDHPLAFHAMVAATPEDLAAECGP